MTVVYSQEALFEISDFIDSVNIYGAGDRWTVKFTAKIKKYALSNVTYALCKDGYLASLGLMCVSLNDWVVAFAIEDGMFIVHKIVRGSILF